MNKIKCNKFTIYGDLSQYKDSMLFNKGTKVAESSFEYGDKQLSISLEVCGDVSVTYKGVNYRTPSEFPEELKEKMAKSIEDNDYLYSSIDDFEIFYNNWYEYVLSNNGETTVLEDDVSKMTPCDILFDMFDIAEGHLCV